MLRSACILVLACFAVVFSTQDVQARKFKLNKSDATGWWGWECKDGSASGWAATKAEAKDAARDACGGSSLNANYTEPGSSVYGTQYELGVYSGVLVQTLENEDVLYDASEIRESAANYLFDGSTTDLTLTDAEIVAAQLQAWGIYLGGTTQAQLSSNHNLTAAQFQRIVDQDFDTGYVTVEGGALYVWEW